MKIIENPEARNILRAFGIISVIALCIAIVQSVILVFFAKLMQPTNHLPSEYGNGSYSYISSSEEIKLVVSEEKYRIVMGYIKNKTETINIELYFEFFGSGGDEIVATIRDIDTDRYMGICIVECNGKTMNLYNSTTSTYSNFFESNSSVENNFFSYFSSDEISLVREN